MTVPCTGQYTNYTRSTNKSLNPSVKKTSLMCPSQQKQKAIVALSSAKPRLEVKLKRGNKIKSRSSHVLSPCICGEKDEEALRPSAPAPPPPPPPQTKGVLQERARDTLRTGGELVTKHEVSVSLNLNVKKVMYNKVRRLGLSKCPVFCLAGIRISSSLIKVGD